MEKDSLLAEGTGQKMRPRTHTVGSVLHEEGYSEIEIEVVGGFSQKGGWFSLIQYNRWNGVALDEEYLTVFLRKATGVEDTLYLRYRENFLAVVCKQCSNMWDADSFETDAETLRRQVDSLVAEIAQNLDDGKKDPIANLKTKFTVDEMNFTYDQLKKVVGAMEQIAAAPRCDYDRPDLNFFVSQNLCRTVHASSLRALNNAQGMFLEDKLRERVAPELLEQLRL